LKTFSPGLGTLEKLKIYQKLQSNQIFLIIKSLEKSVSWTTGHKTNSNRELCPVTGARKMFCYTKGVSKYRGKERDSIGTKSSCKSGQLGDPCSTTGGEISGPDILLVWSGDVEEYFNGLTPHISWDVGSLEKYFVSIRPLLQV
jgi:hypothetical protein